MKLLHTSDWHLGQNFMGKSRKAEHEAFFTWLLTLLQKEQIDVLVVAGDIFDTATPPNYALQLYYDFLKQLSQLPTLKKTVITAGNHDSVATLNASKKLLEALNVHVISSAEEEQVIGVRDKKNTLHAVICAVPFLRDGMVRKSFGQEGSVEKEQALNQGIKAHYEAVHKKALTLRGEEKVPLIAMGHLTTVGSRSSESERDIYIGGSLDIGGAYLGSLFEYVALGHLHMSQEVGSAHVRYSGSPLPLSFSEAKNTQQVSVVSFEQESMEVVLFDIPRTQNLELIKGDKQKVINALKAIKDTSTWLELHLHDDNPQALNQEVRELANTLGLQLLAVKIEKTEQQLQSRQMRVLSLDELSVEEVFNKRLEQESLEDKSLEKALEKNFLSCLEKVRAQ